MWVAAIDGSAARTSIIEEGLAEIDDCEIAVISGRDRLLARTFSPRTGQFAGHADAALCQKIFDVAQANREAVTEPDSEPDDTPGGKRCRSNETDFLPVPPGGEGPQVERV